MNPKLLLHFQEYTEGWQIRKPTGSVMLWKHFLGFIYLHFQSETGPEGCVIQFNTKLFWTMTLSYDETVISWWEWSLFRMTHIPGKRHHLRQKLRQWYDMPSSDIVIRSQPIWTTTVWAFLKTTPTPKHQFWWLQYNMEKCILHTCIHMIYITCLRVMMLALQVAIAWF